MTDERDQAGRPPQPRSGDFEGGEPQRDPGFNRGEPQHQRHGGGGGGFPDQDGGGAHRGPRRSRYGRRRMPSEGGGVGEGGGGGYQGEPRANRPEQLDDDVDNYLPSFIAGPVNGGSQEHAPQQSAPPPSNQGHGYNQGHGGQSHGGQSHGGQSHGGQSHGSQNHGGQSHGGQGHGGQPRESHNAGGYAPQQHAQGGHPQHHQGGHPQQGHQGHQTHQGGHAPMHVEHQQHVQHVPHVPHVPVPEEPSPEVQAAAAEFAEWEDKNPQLRGLLLCNPTVRRGEPIVRGTRIPARILAAIAKMGSSVEEMLQDYPALTKEGLDAALAFTAAHPRRTAAS